MVEQNLILFYPWCYFLRSSNPLLKKGGRKGGKYTKKGGNDTDRKIPIPAVSDTGKYRYRKND